MKRKRFVKLLMSKGYDRNEANEIARSVVESGQSYEKSYYAGSAILWLFRSGKLKKYISDAMKSANKIISAMAAGFSSLRDTFYAVLLGEDQDAKG